MSNADRNAKRLQGLTVNVRESGAAGDGVTDDSAAIAAASAVAAAAGGGTVAFGSGAFAYTFAKPPYGVTWSFEGAPVTRAQLGGTSSAVLFQRARLSYLDGPHTNSQMQAEHIRAIAKGSNAIGAQYADYALGLTIEKENWSEVGGTPVAGEINGLTIFTRNGAVDGDPVKTGGAAILCNVGATAGSGYTQVLEAVNTVYTKGTLASERGARMLLLGIDEVEDTSYGAVFNTEGGSHNSVIRCVGTTASPWTRIIENYKDSVLTFALSDAGKLSWRQTASMFLEQEVATNDLVFTNEGGTELARLASAGYFRGKRRAPRVVADATYTLDAVEDAERTVSMAGAGAAHTVTLPNDAPIGFRCTVIQRDTGQVTFSAEAGGTLRNVSSHTKTSAQYAVVNLEVAANNDGSSAIWYLSGSTAA